MCLIYKLKMAITGGPDINSINYVLYLDADNIRSYSGGNRWYDLSGSNNHATLFSWGFNESYPKNFTLSNSGSATINSINLASTLNWTVSSWVKTTWAGSALAQGPVLTNNSGGPVNSMMGVGNGKMVYWRYDGSWLSQAGVASVNDGNWHYLTWAQKDDATMVMYVDGVIDVSSFTSTVGGNNYVNSVGKSWGSGSPLYSWQGEIKSITVHNRTLSTSEVLNYYRATKP